MYDPRNATMGENTSDTADALCSARHSFRIRRRQHRLARYSPKTGEGSDKYAREPRPRENVLLRTQGRSLLVRVLQATAGNQVTRQSWLLPEEKGIDHAGLQLPVRRIGFGRLRRFFATETCRLRGQTSRTC
jgi:hypothetical protein